MTGQVDFYVLDSTAPLKLALKTHEVSASADALVSS
jgi:hypothetical protein